MRRALIWDVEMWINTTITGNITMLKLLKQHDYFITCVKLYTFTEQIATVNYKQFTKKIADEDGWYLLYFTPDKNVH